VYLFDFGVGSHHELLAPEKNREHSIADQQLALNVVFMDRIRKKGLSRAGASGVHPAWVLQPAAQVSKAALYSIQHHLVSQDSTVPKT
ncbi:hypothetical protein, partial [Pseudomonas fluorescens]|uniref:hypothetical protein n=1 Tax=Pseudomonas fluorescens TaxID=294 RepID=UPI001E3FA874